MATFVKIQKKNGVSWKAVIRKSGYHYTKTFPLKGAAKAWAAEMEAMMEAKEHGDPRLAEKVSLDDALEKYTEDSQQAGKALSTLAREQTSYKHLRRLLGSNTSLADITTSAVQRYQQKRVGEQASASSIRQELAIISKMYNNARKIWEINVQNPVDNVERVSPGPAKLRFLSAEEAVIVLAEAKKSKNKKFYPYVLLLMHTGMRPGEGAGLHKDNVDVESRTIRLLRTKSGRPRTIPLTNNAVKALQEVEPENTGYFFLKAGHLDSNHVKISPSIVFKACWRALRKRLEKSHPEIKHFTPHSLRHTAASHLLMQGVDIRVVADILGHSTLAMAMRYTHLLDDYRQDVVDKIAFLGE